MSSVYVYAHYGYTHQVTQRPGGIGACLFQLLLPVNGQVRGVWGVWKVDGERKDGKWKEGKGGGRSGE